MATFTVRMNRRALALVGNVEKIVRQVAIVMDGAAVTATAVKTGRARSNWIPSVGFPSSSVNYSPPFRGAQETVGAARAMFSVPLGRNPVVYLTNNVYYIGLLNTGEHGKKSPEGMTGPAMRAGRAYLQRLNGPITRKRIFPRIGAVKGRSIRRTRRSGRTRGRGGRKKR